MALPLSMPLLLACCLWVALAQNDSPKKSIWDDPIKFNTKTKDACLMHVSGQGDYTKLRISCRNKAGSYYCDYQGKPNLCRAYSNNPRHYFTQIMWDLRKLTQACQGPKVLRAPMCKKASDETQMTFVSSWPKPGAAAPKHTVKISYERKPVTQKSTTQKVVTQKPTASKPQSVPKAGAKAPQPKKTTPKPTRGQTTPKPTEHGETRAVKLAKEYCWKSLQGVCSYFISWFHRN